MRPNRAIAPRRLVSALMAGLTAMALLVSIPLAWGENRITDGSSFEVGLDGCALALMAGRFDRECAAVVLETDQSTSVDGAYSVRFVRPVSCRNRYGLFYKPVALQPGESYTFSAYLKCAEDGGQIGLQLGTFPGREQRKPGISAKSPFQMFRVTREWKRYELCVLNLPPSAPAAGTSGFDLYYVAVVPGNMGTTFWIDAVQLTEGEGAKPFSTNKALEVSVSTNRPGNLFWVGETIVPTARVFAPKATEPVDVSCRAIDVLGEEVASSRKKAAVPSDGHLTVSLEGIPAAQRAWLIIEVTASCAGREEKEYVTAAVIERLPPPLANQPCQFGFNFNSVSFSNQFGADAKWHESNIHLNLDRIFRLAPQGGVRWARMADIFFWEGRPSRSCEVSPGKFFSYDKAVQAIKDYGLEMMGTLGNGGARADFCPEWARSRTNDRGTPIPSDEAWRRYVRTMVEHYKKEIKTWEIVNEPNTALYAEDYLPLLRAAYEEAKWADPNCTVVGICATSELDDPYGYVRAVAEAGGLKDVDAVSAHTLCKGRPWQSRSDAMTWDYIASLAGILKQSAPEKRLPIWNTEGVKYSAWTDRPNIAHTTPEYAAERMNRNMAFPQRWAAAYAIRDCAIEYCSGVSDLFLWEFRNAVPNANIAFAGAVGLMDWFAFDGTPQAKFVAINAFAERMRGAKPVEQFGLSPQVRCALFEKSEGPFAMVWRENQDENDTCSYVLPVAARVEAQDMLGRPMKVQRDQGALQVKVSEIPVYLLGGKDLSAAALSTALKEAGKRVDFRLDKPLRNTLIGPRRRGGRGGRDERSKRLPQPDAERVKSTSKPAVTESGVQERGKGSALGIGFVLAPPTELLVSKLSSEKDFVDLMLGPGKVSTIQKLKPPVHMSCIARSLAGMEETISLLKRSGVKPERIYIAYNPEQSPGTPQEELKDFLGSLGRGQKMVREYGARFLVGPGLRYMDEHEDLYPKAAKFCDIWLIQSQRLQMHPDTRQAAPPKEYRDKVKRIVDLLRKGNPNIKIFIQILASRTREETLFTAEQVAAYAAAIEDLVDAIRIYGGQPALIAEVIDRLRPKQP